jgi:hypothetical protein
MLGRLFEKFKSQIVEGDFKNEEEKRKAEDRAMELRRQRMKEETEKRKVMRSRVPFGNT